MHVCCSWVKGERKEVFQRGCGRTQGCGDFRARRITSFSKDMRFDLRVLTRPIFGGKWVLLRGPMYQLSSWPQRNETKALNKFRCEEWT